MELNKPVALNPIFAMDHPLQFENSCVPFIKIKAINRTRMILRFKKKFEPIHLLVLGPPKNPSVVLLEVHGPQIKNHWIKQIQKKIKLKKKTIILHQSF